MPLAVNPLGADVVSLLELYGPKMSVGEAYAHLSALISLRLLQLPLDQRPVVACAVER